MTIAWMVYAIGVALLLFAGAAAAEYVCRAIGAPTRVVWIGASIASAVLGALALREPLPAASAAPAAASVIAGGGVSPRGVPNGDRSVDRPPSAMSIGARVAAFIDAWSDRARSRSGAWDSVASPVCASAAGAGILLLVLAFVRARRLVRGLFVQHVDGHAVFVSESIGPAVIGVFPSRIVVPAWVLDLEQDARQTIVAHEAEHLAYHDALVFCAGALVLALMPWNPALWMLVRRLRLAIEMDCDARVIRRGGNARRYGELLLTIYERAVPRAASVIAFAERRSNLEHRVRRLVGARPRLGSMSGVCAGVCAVGVIVAACETPIPAPAAKGLASSSPAVSVVGVEPRCAKWASPDAPSFAEMKGWALQRHADVINHPKGNTTVVGVLLDENCTIIRDTVLELPPVRGDRAAEFIAKVFGDTTGLVHKGFIFQSPASNDRRNVTTVTFAVRPSALWQARLAHDACGFGVRFDERCHIEGPLELRVLDSLRLLVAIRPFNATNQPAEDVFLITLARPYPEIHSQSMRHGVIAFKAGAVHVSDFLERQPLLLFRPVSSRKLWDLPTDRQTTVIDDLVGIAHYGRGQLTLEQVPRLIPSARCDGPKGACYEVGSLKIQFPG